MRGGLGFKFMAAFAAVIITGGAVMYTVINLSTRRQYQTLARESDIAAAEALSRLFAGYYEQTGSWKGVERFFRLLTEREERVDEGPGGHMRGPRGGMMMRRLGVFSRIVLIGPRGGVVFDSRGSLAGSFHPPRHIERGVPVRAFGSVVGRLFVGTMVEPALDPVERRFLKQVNVMVIIILSVVLAAALLITGFLVRRITGPLKKIERASEKIGSGDFSARVSVANRDELGRVAGRFNRMAASLEEAEIWRRQLISDSAHELRTPMSLIQGRLEMMLEGVYDIDRENVTRVYEEARHMTDLIEELKSLSDADRGELLSRRGPVDVNRLTERAAESFRSRTEARGIRLETRPMSDAAVVEGDEGKLYQVVLNVIGNAVRFTSDGGSIEVRTGREATGKGSGVFISIADTGPGVPRDKLDRIFDRFYRVDEARNREHGGRGLGLAISKAIVESHGGTIRALNCPAGGLEIRIFLPTGE
ncbi:MAG: ATP-binding protein [Spirochaetia bacterium]